MMLRAFGSSPRFFSTASNLKEIVKSRDLPALQKWLVSSTSSSDDDQEHHSFVALAQGAIQFPDIKTLLVDENPSLLLNLITNRNNNTSSLEEKASQYYLLNQLLLLNPNSTLKGDDKGSSNLVKFLQNDFKNSSSSSASHPIIEKSLWNTIAILSSTNPEIALLSIEDSELVEVKDSEIISQSLGTLFSVLSLKQKQRFNNTFLIQMLETEGGDDSLRWYWPISQLVLNNPDGQELLSDSLRLHVIPKLFDTTNNNVTEEAKVLLLTTLYASITPFHLQNYNIIEPHYVELQKIVNDLKNQSENVRKSAGLALKALDSGFDKE